MPKLDVPYDPCPFVCKDCGDRGEIKDRAEAPAGYAEDIAKVIETRTRPSFEERLAVFRPTGWPEPSREPFPVLSKGGGRPSF
jgi:hypothetical protein